MKKKIEYKADWYYDDEAVAAAKKLESSGFTDWEVVVATDHTLQIDYDRMPVGKTPPKFKQTLKLFAQRFKGTVNLQYELHRSKSGKGNHVVIHIPEALDDLERVAWQAAFGSDGVREALNILRIKRHIKNPVLLFMKKDRDTTLLALPVEEKPKRMFMDD